MRDNPYNGEGNYRDANSRWFDFYLQWRYTLYIEMAANGMFGAGKDGLINAPDASRQYTLSMAEIAVFDPFCYELLLDLTVIIDLAKVNERGRGNGAEGRGEERGPWEGYVEGE